MTRQPTIAAPLDPTEAAYLAARRLARRRQFFAILAAVALALGFAAWKVGSHVLATWWLEANEYEVSWAIDRDNWKQGGVTTALYQAKSYSNFTRQTLTHDLKFLKDLHRLGELDLSKRGGLVDDELAELDKLTDLRRLNLDHSRQSPWGTSLPGELTDATLARIARLTNLRDLNLAGQKVTDAGLEHLAGLDHLGLLDLTGTEITDRGLEPLKALPGLKVLDLTGTRVTAQGVGAFEAARPGVRVVAEHLPIVPQDLTSPGPKTAP